MSAPVPSFSRVAWITMYSVIGFGSVVLAHAAWDLVSHPADPKWLILVALTAGTGWVMLRIPKTEISFSISDTFNIASAVLFGPSAGAVTAALDGLVLSAQFDRPYRTPFRILFNVAASALSIWLAAHLFFALAGGIALRSSWTAVRLMALLALFGAVNYLVNTGLVALAIA